MTSQEEEEFVLEEVPEDPKTAGSTRLVVAYEDATIKDLREEIKRLHKKIDRIHWLNAIARVGWVVLNPSFHLQNASKDVLYRVASYVARQFM